MVKLQSSKTESKQNIYVVKAESGTFWEINLKTAEVKEYEEQVNPWKERGLTSSNVVYDKVYSYDGAKGNLGFEDFTAYSNGGLMFVEEIPSEDFQTGYNAGVFVIGSNYVIVPYDETGGYMAFEFDEYGKLKMYIAKHPENNSIEAIKAAAQAAEAEFEISGSHSNGIIVQYIAEN